MSQLLTKPYETNNHDFNKETIVQSNAEGTLIRFKDTERGFVYWGLLIERSIKWFGVEGHNPNLTLTQMLDDIYSGERTDITYTDIRILDECYPNTVEPLRFRVEAYSNIKLSNLDDYKNDKLGMF